MIRAEARNLPHVLKEAMVVITSGGLTAFIATLAILSALRRQYPVEWRFAAVVAAVALKLGDGSLSFGVRRTLFVPLGTLGASRRRTFPRP
jgi:hypothetical protein